MGDEISARYLNTVKVARKDLENETEEILKGFMNFRLKVAEEDLNREKQRIEEEEI